MKAALAICFSLLLVWLQVASAEPMAGCAVSPAYHDCGCGGKMPCCTARKATPMPVDRTVSRVSVSDSLFVSVPALGLLGFPSAGTFLFSAFRSPVPAVPRPGLFLRDCALLI